MDGWMDAHGWMLSAIVIEHIKSGIIDQKGGAIAWCGSIAWVPTRSVNSIGKVGRRSIETEKTMGQIETVGDRSTDGSTRSEK